jgi:SAM-dependent methyltransferase
MPENINQRIRGSWSHHDAMRHWMYERVCDAMFRINFAPRSPLDVLEYGSLEPTTYVMRMLKHRFGEQAINAQVTPEFPDPKGDCCAFVWPEECVDVLILDQVLEHTITPWVVPANMYRMLRPGGVVVVTTPFMFPLHYCPVDAWRFTPQTYERLFSDFKTIELGQWGGEAALRWYLQDNHMLNFIPVEQAERELPGWNEPDFQTSYPMVVWYVGQKPY